MHHGQPVDQDRDVVPVRVGAFNLILIDDLEPVVMNSLLIDQQDVLGRVVVPLEQLDVVFLDPLRLFDDPVRLPRDPLMEEPFPLRVTERVGVQSL